MDASTPRGQRKRRAVSMRTRSQAAAALGGDEFDDADECCAADGGLGARVPVDYGRGAGATTGVAADGVGVDAHTIRDAVAREVARTGARLVNWVGAPAYENHRSSVALTCAIEGSISGALENNLAVALERAVDVSLTTGRDGVALMRVTVWGRKFARRTDMWLWIVLCILVSMLLGAVLESVTRSTTALLAAKP